MTFATNPDVDASKQTEDGEIGSALVTALPSVLPKAGNRLLPTLEPVIFVEAKDSSLGSELDAEKYEPINVPCKIDQPSQTNGEVCYDLLYAII